MEKKYKLIPSDKEGLFRVKALRDFGSVKKGDIGGYVESEHNLSHEGYCWIYEDACVCDDALVRDDACVCDNALVRDNAKLGGNAIVYDNAIVRGYAEVFDNAQVYGNANVCDNVWLYGKAEVHGEISICGNALIEKINDYIVFKNSWSSGRYFTYTRSNNMWKVGCFYGTGEELIQKAYKDSELNGKMYKKCVEFVKELLNDEKDL